MLYGPGISNLLNILYHLVRMFMVLSLLAFCQTLLFLCLGPARDSLSFQAILAKMSFANIGFSEPFCSKASIDWTAKEVPFVFEC